MWSDFEIESTVLLKDYKDPGVDVDSILDADEAANQRCKNLKSEKQRLGCWYTLALAEHASFLEMHPSWSTRSIVYGDQERAQKLLAAEKAYSKVHGNLRGKNVECFISRLQSTYVDAPFSLWLLVPLGRNVDAVNRFEQVRHVAPDERLPLHGIRSGWDDFCSLANKTCPRF